MFKNFRRFSRGSEVHMAMTLTFFKTNIQESLFTEMEHI